MELNPIKHIEAEKIIKEIGTEGSAPLQLLVNDGKIYFSKTTTPQVPCVEVINEILCAYFLQCWNLKVPDFALIKIDQELITNFEKEKGKLSARYKANSFENKSFFSSEQKSPAIELDKYFGKLERKTDLKQFNSPLDLIKIGVFDLWIGNKDRKPDNPNILIGGIEESFDFHPIDHTAAFAYCSDYRMVNDNFLFMEERFRILKHPLVNSIANFATPVSVQNLKNDILSGMNFTLESLNFIFEQVPSEWGFSKKAKEHLKSFLSDNERNERIASSYLGHLKK